MAARTAAASRRDRTRRSPRTACVVAFVAGRKIIYNYTESSIYSTIDQSWPPLSKLNMGVQTTREAFFLLLIIFFQNIQ